MRAAEIEIIEQEIIQVTQDLIRIPSANPPGDEKEVANYIIDYLKNNGLEVNTQKIAPFRYNVVARIKGKGVVSPLMFSGHMDVVPVSTYEAKRWDFDPFGGEIDQGYIYGRGAADAKGGLAAAMVALSTLASHNIEPLGDIIFAATVDEEGLMLGSKGLLNNELIANVKRVICCEPTDLELKIACKGRMWGDITVYGQTAHTAIRGGGRNAITGALKLMIHMENHRFSHIQHQYIERTFWQTTMIQGGIERNIVPDTCTLNVDIRLAPGQTPDEVWGEMEKIFTEIKKEIPNFQATINEVERREAWRIDVNDKIVKTAAKACELAGLPVVYSGYLATADGTIYRQGGIPGLILGPGTLDNNAYKENERVSIQQVIDAAKIYLTTMLTWGKV